MALTQIPPWIADPNRFVDSAAKGVGLGLQASQIATGANEAADRLRLSYAQLAAQQASHAASVGAQQADAAARMAFARERAQEEQALQQERLGLASRHQGMLEENAADRLREAGGKKILHVGGGIYRINPKTGEVETALAPPEAMHPIDREDYNRLWQELNLQNVALGKEGLEEGTKTSIRNRIAEINQGIRTIRDKYMKTAAPSAGGGESAAAGLTLPIEESDTIPGTTFTIPRLAGASPEPAPASGLTPPPNLGTGSMTLPGVGGGAPKRLTYNPETGTFE